MNEEVDQSNKEVSSLGNHRPGRTWTQRLIPFAYRRFSVIDSGGRHSILFQVENAPGSNRMDSMVYEIFNDMKLFDGKPSPLRYVRDTKLGKGWRLPDDHIGRTIADILDARLEKLADTMEQDSGRTR